MIIPILVLTEYLRKRSNKLLSASIQRHQNCPIAPPEWLRSSVICASYLSSACCLIICPSFQPPLLLLLLLSLCPLYHGVSTKLPPHLQPHFGDPGTLANHPLAERGHMSHDYASSVSNAVKQLRRCREFLPQRLISRFKNMVDSNSPARSIPFEPLMPRQETELHAQS